MVRLVFVAYAAETYATEAMASRTIFARPTPGAGTTTTGVPFSVRTSAVGMVTSATFTPPPPRTLPVATITSLLPSAPVPAGTWRAARRPAPRGASADVQGRRSSHRDAAGD